MNDCLIDWFIDFEMIDLDCLIDLYKQTIFVYMSTSDVKSELHIHYCITYSQFLLLRL